MERNISECKVSNNAKSSSKQKQHSQNTAAWANQFEMTPDANVSIPSELAVDEAKGWVDNGSKL